MSKTPPAERASPFEAQRKMHELLAQETRHHIIQTILGHPTRLPSLLELAYYSQKSESAVLDQLDVLESHDLVTTYTLGESRGKRDLPSTFYGLTEQGLRVLGEFKYLRGVPALRVLHEETVKTARIRRHEAAPRPDLPIVVRDGLDFDAAADVADVPDDKPDPLPTVFYDEATAAEDGAFRDLF